MRGNVTAILNDPPHYRADLVLWWMFKITQVWRVA